MSPPRHRVTRAVIRRVTLSALDRVGRRQHPLLADEGRNAPLVTVPVVSTLGLALVSSATQARDFVLREGGGDEQAQLNGQSLQGVLHQGEQLVAIQRQLDLSAGLRAPGNRAGRLLSRVLRVGMGSIQGSSSSRAL
jgi:hypothetical protein